MLTFVTWLAVSLATTASLVWVTCWYLDIPKAHSPLEPPVFPSKIPFVGHIIGLLRHGLVYYQMTSAKCRFPIYTLGMLGGKVYVVTSPELVTAVHRNPKALAFNPFIAAIGMRLTGHDEATSQIVQHNLNGEEGPGYVTDVHASTVAALAPGPNLATMLKQLLEAVDGGLLSLPSGIPFEADFFKWTRTMMTRCSTRAIYGPSSPFVESPELCELFWDFDNDINTLMLNVYPDLLAPKGAKARAALGTAFQKYFENFDQAQSSPMTQARYASANRYDITLWNQGRLEVGTLIGILANTIPSTFYMLIHICSDSTLLQDVREELEATSVSVSSTNKAARTFHAGKLRENCPLLHSVWQEMFRFHAQGASSRFVREDVMLDGKYLLKKNMVVQMPTAIMHSDPSIWGDDARVFQPRRFMEGSSRKTAKSAAAYRPFGGGTSLCPGRHFVTLETLALTAYILLRFDIAPSKGPWYIPAPKQESLATNVFPPGEDIRVKIGKRKGYEDIEWSFSV